MDNLSESYAVVIDYYSSANAEISLHINYSKVCIPQCTMYTRIARAFADFSARARQLINQSQRAKKSRDCHVTGRFRALITFCDLVVRVVVCMFLSSDIVNTFCERILPNACHLKGLIS